MEGLRFYKASRHDAGHGVSEESKKEPLRRSRCAASEFKNSATPGFRDAQRPLLEFLDSSVVRDLVGENAVGYDLGVLGDSGQGTGAKQYLKVRQLVLVALHQTVQESGRGGAVHDELPGCL